MKSLRGISRASPKTIIVYWQDQINAGPLMYRTHAGVSLEEELRDFTKHGPKGSIDVEYFIDDDSSHLPFLVIML